MRIDNSVRVEQLKACAEIIIKYAEDIIGSFEQNGQIVVSITICPEEQVPSVNISRDIFPKK